jgi:hypothetical protein
VADVRDFFTYCGDALVGMQFWDVPRCVDYSTKYFVLESLQNFYIGRACRSPLWCAVLTDMSTRNLPGGGRRVRLTTLPTSLS